VKLVRQHCLAAEANPRGQSGRIPRLDLLVIDEAHHAIAQSYRRIIDRARKQNPIAESMA
jgi:superfamily II DNA or RNA helicase